MGTTGTSESMLHIERAVMDEDDRYYRLAGQLLGTAWNHRDYGTVEIEKARQNVTSEQGHRMSHPEITFSNGKRVSVSGFVTLMKKGIVEPAGDTVADVIASELG